jgi:hypothetical protein
MKKIPVDILNKYDAYYSKDSIFGANARLMQCIWRENNGYPVEPGKRGNYLEKDFARKEGKNFITENAWRLAQQAVKNKGDKLINEARLFENLLSSQPLCFNLFSELSINPGLATQLFHKLFPERVGMVTKIDFEHSPGRGNEEYTGDGSAFDVFVEYVSCGGKKGFIGIEVKYAENLKDDPKTAARSYEKNKDAYLRITKASNIFKNGREENLKNVPLQQIWRDHLLALSVLQKGDYSEGFFMYLYPKDNMECTRALESYAEQMKAADPAVNCFYAVYLETLVEALEGISAEPWIRLFKERYLEF